MFPFSKKEVIQPDTNFPQPQAVGPLPHTHEWVALSKTYAPPRRSLIQGLEGEVLQHALFGVTTILWECGICKELRKAYSLGSDKSELDELLDKTDLYGPQYLQRDGKTYSIIIPGQNNPQMFPLK